MKKVFQLFLILFTTLAFSCSKEESSSSSISSSNIEPSTSIGNNSSSSLLEEISYLDLFDYHNTVKVNLTISSAELQKIQDDYRKYPKSPIYRRASQVQITLTKNHKEYTYSFDDVGIRMKGNTSRREFIHDNNEIYANIHFKLSFEETFDDPTYYEPSERIIWNSQTEKEERQNRDFLGMSKLDFRFNKMEDQSWIKEYYALEMFRSFGILSQHSNFSSVTINQDGEKEIQYGVYLMTEALTKTFIKRSLSNASYLNLLPWDEEKKGKYGVSGSKYGQFYKASLAQGDFTSTDNYLFGVDPENGQPAPVYELKTNKENGGDHSQIKEMIQALKNKDEAEIASFVDLDYFAMYEAIATVLGNPDDIRNNANNFAMYFKRSDGKMVIIPIDEDRVLGSSKDWDPSNNAMTEVSPFERKAIGKGQNQANPLYLKTILDASSETRTKYVENLKKVMNSQWVKEDFFTSIYEEVRQNYEDISSTSWNSIPWSLNETYKGSQGNMSFHAYMEKKLATINNAILHSGEEKSEIASCSHFYFRYSQNWFDINESNAFTYKNEDQYEFYHTIDERDINQFEFKVYASDLNQGTWLTTTKNGGKLTSSGGNVIVNLSSQDLGKNFHLIVTLSSGILTWEII